MSVLLDLALLSELGLVQDIFNGFEHIWQWQRPSPLSWLLSL
jgi:hypothetical protein